MTATPPAGAVDPNEVRAVVFDFDGTLVDTMPLHFEAYRRAFSECAGVELTADVFAAEVGGTAREVVPALLAHYGATADPIALHARKKELLLVVLAESELPVLETAKLLPVLAAHLPLALASSGSREGIEVMLDQLGWTKVFDVVLTGEDVDRGKPAPDIFSLAAERLGVAPSACLAFEDTDAGVAAATAAGMTVFDVRATQVTP